MDSPNVLSNYSLPTLSLSDLAHLSCCRLWCMSLVELYHPLSFGLYLGWKLINYMGFFCTFNA